MAGEDPASNWTPGERGRPASGRWRRGRDTGRGDVATPSDGKGGPPAAPAGPATEAVSPTDTTSTRPTGEAATTQPGFGILATLLAIVGVARYSRR